MANVENGVLTVISGFSGVGKGTIVKELVRRHDYALSISATTRNPRPGEEDGREYFFLTREKFQEMIDGDGFIEWAEYVGNRYGTPRKYVEDKLAEGSDVILEIEPQGAMNVKRLYPEAVLIFVVPPSADALAERLSGRGSETPEQIAGRLARAAEETIYIKDYDYVVPNDDLETAILDVHGIIHSAKFLNGHNKAFVDGLTVELKEKYGKK